MFITFVTILNVLHMNFIISCLVDLKVHINLRQFLFCRIDEPKRADKFFYNFWSITFFLELYHFKYAYLHKKSRINEAWDSGT